MIGMKKNLPQALELGIKLIVDTNGTLIADFRAEQNPKPKTEAWQLGNIIETEGYTASDFPLDFIGLQKLADAINSNTSSKIAIAGPKDASFSVQMSHNAVVVGAVIYPPRGKGDMFSRENFEKELRSFKISRGWRNDNIDYIFSEKFEKELRNSKYPICMLIATGTSPIESQDAQMETLVKNFSDRRPIMHEDGKVDFLDLGEFPFVKAGTKIVRKHPPILGRSGITVQGKSIKIRKGKDLNFRAMDSSVVPDELDENILIAAVDGMPVIEKNKAKIEKVLKIGEVGIKTGHVKFDGSVMITGNISTSMKVEVTGDIRVSGLVEKAYLNAGGNIEILGGALGQKRENHSVREWRKQQQEPSKDSAILIAGGNVKARFLQECWVEAESVLVEKQVMHSVLQAKEIIQVEGKLIGGLTICGNIVEVGITSAPANVDTNIEVGSGSALQKKLAEISEQLDHIKYQMDQLKDMVNKIKNTGKSITNEKRDQILKARDTLNQQQELLEMEKSSIESEITLKTLAKVYVKQKCYPGTIIKIAQASYNPRNELGQVTFYLRDNEVRMR